MNSLKAFHLRKPFIVKVPARSFNDSFIRLYWPVKFWLSIVRLLLI